MTIGNSVECQAGCGPVEPEALVMAPPCAEVKGEVAAQEAFEMYRDFFVRRGYNHGTLAKMLGYANIHPFISEPAMRCKETIELNECQVFYRFKPQGQPVIFVPRSEAIADRLPHARLPEDVPTGSYF